MVTSENPTELAGRIIQHYEKHGRDWDADRRENGWNDKPWHDRFIAALPDGATVLDLGCGAGSPVAVNMVERGLRVTGVDASATLVSLCRDRMPNQKWLVGDMRTISLNQKFDGVLAWDSFFHLKPDDQRDMFDVFAAHAAPSAVLMFNTGPSHGEGIGSYRGDPLYHASLDAAEYQTLLAQHGFQVVAHAITDWKTGGPSNGLAGSAISALSVNFGPPPPQGGRTDCWTATWTSAGAAGKRPSRGHDIGRAVRSMA